VRPLVAAALAGALVLSAAATLASGPRQAGSGSMDRRLVLVSGRDDHGLLAAAQVALREHPGGGNGVAQVDDGTLAEVVSTQGTWLEVRTVEGRTVQGWVDDFYLRGSVHLIGPAPACQVQLGGQWLAAGEQAVVLDVRGAQAQVRVIRTGQVGWIERSTVHELAPEHDCAQPATVTPPDGHSHNHDGH